MTNKIIQILTVITCFLFLFSACNKIKNNNIVYLDPAATTENRVNDLMQRMTLEDKVYQMNQFVGLDHMRKGNPNDDKANNDAQGFYKDLSINDDIERLRLSTTSSLLSGRRDVLVVASVSCLYGIGNPNEFKKNVIPIQVDQQIARTKFLHQLVQSLYSRTEHEIKSGTFKVKGDVVILSKLSLNADPLQIKIYFNSLGFIVINCKYFQFS